MKDQLIRPKEPRDGQRLKKSLRGLRLKLLSIVCKVAFHISSLKRKEHDSLIINKVDPLAKYDGKEREVDIQILVWEGFSHDNFPTVNFRLDFRNGMSRDEAITKLVAIGALLTQYADRVVDESVQKDQDTSRSKRVTH